MNSAALQKYWLPLTLSEDVGSSPKQFKLLGDNLVAYRDAKGIVVLKDLCAHRGAALSNGSLTNGNLTCPYHGWQYDRTGACVVIPSLPPGAEIPRNAKAIVYQSKEAYALVWVCLSPDAPAFPSWPDDAWERSDYHVFMVGEYCWQANAARVIENALDFSHFNIAHVGLTELANGPVVTEHQVTTENDIVRLSYEDGHLRRDYTLHFPFMIHDRKKVIEPASGATWSDGADSKLDDITIITFIASPISDTESRIFVFVARNHSLDADDRAFTESFNTVMEQDRVIVESQRPHLIPENPAEEMHVRYADLGSVAYRRLWRAAREAAR